MSLKMHARFLQYLLFSWHRNGHGIHSPYVYKMVTEAFRAARKKNGFEPEEAWRNLQLKNNSVVSVADYGAGSKRLGAARKVSDIVRCSAVAPRYGRLLASLVRWSESKTVLELGTSVGVGSRYLSKYANTVVSVDACPETLSVAEENAPKNCSFYCGTFTDVLPKLATQNSLFDFVYIDGNHTFSGTLENFELVLPLLHNQSIVVFDDIHWSDEMFRAWKQICLHPSVRVSVDLWQMGIVLLRPEMTKQDFIVRY